jgi:signal transduction histidine kinase
MLLKADPPRLQDIAEILGDIRRDDQRASDIIARVRTLVRKSEPEILDMDLNQAIGEAVKVLSADASAKGMSVKTELYAGLPQVRADRVQVQQVILNLALNAMEAMQDQPAEKREVVIRSTRANGREAEVSVADSGAGIPAQMLARIFEPFVTTKPAGMGLGLAICRSIVEAQGGHIGAESRPEGGAVIRFTLPLAADRGASGGG